MRWEETLHSMTTVVIESIPDDRWPDEDFRTSMCVTGVEKLLHEHSEFEALLKEKNEMRLTIQRISLVSLSNYETQRLFGVAG